MPKIVGGRPIPDQIYDLVRVRPRSVPEIICSIWWVHPQDAPRPPTIKAHIWRLNQQLRGRKQRVVGEWGGAHHRESLYRLVTLR